jgi:hypothetical protein
MFFGDSCFTTESEVIEDILTCSRTWLNLFVISRLYSLTLSKNYSHNLMSSAGLGLLYSLLNRLMIALIRSCESLSTCRLINWFIALLYEASSSVLIPDLLTKESYSWLVFVVSCPIIYLGISSSKSILFRSIVLSSIPEISRIGWFPYECCLFLSIWRKTIQARSY